MLLGDGCLMEGISHEACSLAGVLGLGKLICIYDDNGISIDGEVEGWFRDDTPGRFEAYGWHVVRGVDGHDVEALQAALDEAVADSGRPSLICARTVIGFGAPNKQGTAATHGAPLGEAEIAAARETLNWPHPPFEVPGAIRSAWDIRERGAGQADDWRERFAAYRSAFPEPAAEYERRMQGRLPDDWAARSLREIERIAAENRTEATRKSSLGALEAFAPMLPELIGGSADLTGSNCTRHSGSVGVTTEGGGNYVYFGVREFAMGAMLNGMALHGGFIPYGGTFLTFSDYQRNALRMAALMRQRCIFVFTHDSIGVGEDGPTHQPIEHLESLRIIPNMRVWRPCDAVEAAVAWREAIERRDGPTSLALSRQGLPAQARSAEQLAQVERGGYVLKREAAGRPDVLLIATGSEVQLAMGGVRIAGGRGHCRARGVDALRVRLHAAGRGLPRVRTARKGAGPGRGRSRRSERLAGHCRRAGPRAWHRPLRRIGARRPAVRAFWIYGRGGGRAGARIHRRGAQPGIRLRNTSERNNRNQRLWANRALRSARALRGAASRCHADRGHQ